MITYSTFAAELDLITFQQDGDQQTKNVALFSASASGQSTAFTSGDWYMITGETKPGVLLRNVDTNHIQRVHYQPNGDLYNQVMTLQYMTANKRYYLINTNEAGLDVNVLEGSGGKNTYLYDAVNKNYTAIGVTNEGDQEIIGVAQVSEDGRYVVYSSVRTIIDAYQDNGKNQLYLYDVATKQTKLITKGVDDKVFNDGAGYASLQRVISSDGQSVVFSSVSYNGYAQHQPQQMNSNLYLYNTATDSLEILNKFSDGTVAQHDFTQASISSSGQYITVVANTNIASDRPNQVMSSNGVYKLDRADNSWSYVSVSADKTQTNNGAVGLPSISGDGRYIAYASLSSNLSEIDYNRTWQTYVVDTHTKESEMISVSEVTGLATDGYGAMNSVISDNGEYVFFTTKTQNMVNEHTTKFNVLNLYRGKNPFGSSYSTYPMCEL